MCGIAGRLGDTLNTEQVQRISESLQHRGPDDSGFHHGDNFSLVFRRLSILDEKYGHQPMWSSDKSSLIVFNGEIYNHVEIRRELEKRGSTFSSEHSDTEVLLELYRHYGCEMFSHIKGMFAFCLVDLKKKSALIARDRFGIKPLYYKHDEKSKALSFTSEFPVLREERKKSLEARKLVSYFSQKSLIGEDTMETAIQKLPPGHYLFLDQKGELSKKCYYEIFYTVKRKNESEASLLNTLEELLIKSTAQHLRADVPVGFLLSGGVDSSLLVAIASKIFNSRMKTYNLVFKSDDSAPASNEDSYFAKKVSEQYKTDHREIVVKPEELVEALPHILRRFSQPFSASISTWFLAKEMAKDVKVGVCGDGADEIFGSYFLHRVAALADTLDFEKQQPSYVSDKEWNFVKNTPKNITSYIEAFGVFSPSEIKELLHCDTEDIATFYESIQRRVNSLDPTQGFLSQMLEYDCRSTLVDSILYFTDLLSMDHSIEFRVPFLDHELVEFAFSLEDSYRIREAHGKYLLKRLAEKYLPHDLIYRPKVGFVEPGISWLRSELKEHCLERLKSPCFNSLGFLNQNYVNYIAKSFYENHDFFLGKKLWSLFMYSYWEEMIQNG